MTVRKPKSTLASIMELPAEKLQLATVTVEQKPAHGGQGRQATELPAARSLPLRGKITLH
jgi:hypothetical protein